MTELKIGSAAPAFDMVDADGKKASWRNPKGQWVVLYFHPKDDTPGRTKWAKVKAEGHADQVRGKLTELRGS